jgi:nitrite reductase/ring-hydroxylating ferredoxin subunit
MAKEKKQVEVGKVADFIPGKIKIVEIDGREIGVALRSNGKFCAVRNHCPHKGAPICRGMITGTFLPSGPGEMVYGMDGQLLVCPWHGFEFDLETGKALTDEKMKLLMYPTSVEDGSVYVTL